MMMQHNASRSRHTQLLGWRLFATHSVNRGQLGSLAGVGSVRFDSVRFHKRASVNMVLVLHACRSCLHS